ncbi:TetR/AcrR family transcriptional regulator [Sphaerisporangium fuscum]|uniref:TetR/AcrR family transcriptional regulator n=1 Tax=Sphaerisporangium fuscum TaxID=2835868 RepID=UPI001BDCC748|nr:TetR/AcrR family transcriptional regulator [Sphaerisporangium fuscum]
MGNREDLLAGAKRCLYEKGYARTTARDIAAASGVVSLAAIGYHYGSKEALLNAAFQEAMKEWGEELGRSLAMEADPQATPEERFEAAWRAVVRSFSENRPLWTLQFEVIAQLQKVPELRQTFAESVRQARLGLVGLFGDFGLGADDEQAQAIGALYQSMLIGTASQWLVDPETAPSARDLLQALRGLAPGLVGTGAGA